MSKNTPINWEFSDPRNQKRQNPQGASGTDFEGDGYRPRGARFKRGTLGSRPKLPMFFAFSVLFFGVMFTSLAILMSKSEKVEANTNKERVVVVEKEAPIEMVSILVPVQEIEQGKKLEPSMFKMEKRPKLAVPQNAIKTFEELKGQYARSIIPTGQAVGKEFVTGIKPPNTVISMIPQGYRAVTINVNATTGVEGWAQAGASVDVQWINDVLGDRMAKLLVQNAKVLSAERQTDPNQQPGQPIPTTVTLAVTDVDAQKISLASTGGQLMLHLRGPNDLGKGGSVSQISFKDLVGRGDKDDRGGIDGYAKTRNPDGSVREWAIAGGKVVEKRK